MNENAEEIKKVKKTKKMVKIIIASMIGALVVLSLLVWLLESVANGEMENETMPPIDPSKLHETKDEDFDIMEYEEYLAYDRSIYIENKGTGVTQSVSEEECRNHGEGFELLYRVIIAINEGDYDTYNSLMGKKALKKEEFTQQQIYDIKVVIQSSGRVSEDGLSYDEYVFKVTYKIHENNGTYRNTIVSDVSRPEYFIINNSTGELLVMDIIEQGYKK